MRPRHLRSAMHEKESTPIKKSSSAVFNEQEAICSLKGSHLTRWRGDWLFNNFRERWKCLQSVHPGEEVDTADNVKTPYWT